MNLKELKCEENNIDIDKYMEFRSYVREKMDHPEWFGEMTKEDVLNLLENGSKIWIYYFNNEPVCSMMLMKIGKKEIEQYGIDKDYNEGCDYGPIFVNPKFIGKGLQLQMLKELDSFCIKNGYKYGVATIHPDNIYSMNNFLKDNFKFIKLGDFERGKRNIYLKELV